MRFIEVHAYIVETIPWASTLEKKSSSVIVVVFYWHVSCISPMAMQKNNALVNYNYGPHPRDTAVKLIFDL